MSDRRTSTFRDSSYSHYHDRHRRRRHHEDRDDRQHGRRSDGGNTSSGSGVHYSVPKVNDIFQGIVVSIMDYGAFVRIPNCIKNGLVHKSQLSKCRVNNVSEVVSVDDRVWCKVVSLGEDSNKISLSMKSVNQGNGQDLDPNGVQAGLDENRRRVYTPYSQPKIALDAVFNTVCKKCNTKGHLAQDCFQSSGGKSYQLIDDDDDDRKQKSPSFKDSLEKHKKHKKHKAKKHKDQPHKRRSVLKRSSSDVDESPPSPSVRKSKKPTKGRKRKRERVSSSSDSESTSGGSDCKSSKRKNKTR